MSVIPLTIAVPLAMLCVTIIYMDLRHMRIPDWISVATVALFGLWGVVDYPALPITSRLITAGVVFCICFALFAARIMGGGDTKVIPALSLFIPLSSMSAVMLLFAVCLFASIGLLVTARKVFAFQNEYWTALRTRKLPMGVAIGMTGLIGLAGSHF